MFRGNRILRGLDFICGSSALYLIGQVRHRRPIPRQICTIGILSCATIGDTIIASAVARDLKSALPEARITGFIAASSTGITHVLEGFDEEIHLPATNFLSARRILDAHPTDVLIDFSPWPRITALLAAAAPTRLTVGFRTPGALRHFAYDVSVEHLADCHEINNFRRLVTPLGITGKSLPRAVPDLRWQIQDHNAASGPLVFHPWASGYRSDMREWPLDSWVELARRMITRGYHIVITGGPSDRVRSEHLADLIQRPDHVRILAGRAALVGTARCLVRAAAVVSVNTGIMHLAAALQRPLVALHGPTDPQRWGPLGPAAITIGPGRDNGGAYLNLGFEYPPGVPDCMPKISVNEVFSALFGLLMRHPNEDAEGGAPLSRGRPQTEHHTDGDGSADSGELVQ